MYAFFIIVTGLAIAHALLAVFYLSGCCVFDEPADDRYEAAVAIGVRIAVGMAILAFEAFALGLFGMLDAAGLGVVLVANGVFLIWFRLRREPLAFLQRHFAICLAAARSPVIIVYFVLLLLSTHAALPDYTSDGVRVHLPVAYEWALHHNLNVDSDVRLPYYARNYELLYASMFAAGAGRYIGFLNWLSGSLACALVAGLIGMLDSRRNERTAFGRFCAAAACVLLALSVCISPAFLRWYGSALVDIAYGYLFITVAAAALLSMRGRRGALASCALIAAMLIGAKPSFVLLGPPCALLLLAVAHRARLSRLRTAALIAMMCVLSSPWYIRNIALDGDPIPPVLNLALRGHDSLYTKADWAGQTTDFGTNRSVSALVSFPLRIYIATPSNDFREYGVTAVTLGLYLIAFVTFAAVIRRKGDRNADQGALFLALATFVGVGYLFATSTLARYTLLFYPTMAAATGAALLYCSRWFLPMPLVPVLALLACVPSRGTRPFFADYWDINYRYIADVMPTDRALLERKLDGYREIEPLLTAARPRKSKTLYIAASVPLQYYLNRAGWRTLGDWFGPWRYRDFAVAIDDGSLARYIAVNRISAFVVKPHGEVLSPIEAASLSRQLIGLGFKRLSTSDADFAVYLASEPKHSVEHNS